MINPHSLLLFDTGAPRSSCHSVSLLYWPDQQVNGGGGGHADAPKRKQGRIKAGSTASAYQSPDPARSEI